MEIASEEKLAHLNDSWTQKRVPSSAWRDLEYSLYFQ
jgi:hypothetical protein